MTRCSERRGKKIWAASWFHDGSAPGPAKTGYGNNWVVAAIVVKLPFLPRPVALPVLAKLVVKGTTSASRLWLARRMASALAAALPGRRIHVVGGAALCGEGAEEAGAGDHLDHPAAQGRGPARPAARPDRAARRPRARGDRLPSLARLAAGKAFAQVTVTRYGTTVTLQAAALTCLWYSCSAPGPSRWC